MLPLVGKTKVKVNPFEFYQNISKAIRISSDFAKTVFLQRVKTHLIM